MVCDEKNAKLWAGRGGRGGITDTGEGLVVGLRRGKAKITNRRDCVGDREEVVHGSGCASPAANSAIHDLDLGCRRRGIGQNQAETNKHSKRLQDHSVAHGQTMTQLDVLSYFLIPKTICSKRKEGFVNHWHSEGIPRF